MSNFTSSRAASPASRTVVAVLFGGCSTEYAISLQSAHAVLTHLDASRFEAVMIGITRTGDWLYYTGSLDAIANDTWHTHSQDCAACAILPCRTVPTLLIYGNTPANSCQTLPFDIAFPVLHGKNGEDGTVQGLLELAAIPLVGCGTLASALCMDKDRAHQLAARAGIAVPRSVVFRRDTDCSEIAQGAAALGYPVFVKPVRAGSSFGITKVLTADALQTAVQEAFAHDNEIVLEETITGFEVGCAVMGSKTIISGTIDEIEIKSDFFDFIEKYNLNTAQIHCPARISPAKAEEIRQAAHMVYRALGCNVLARVDLFLTAEGNIVFNEVNTIPGFTAHSRYPNMMKGAGLSFGALVTRLIELGMEDAHENTDDITA